MTTTQLQSRIAKLESEVARLKAQVADLTPRKDWWNRLGPRTPATPEDIAIQKDHDRIMRQLKDANRFIDPPPALTRLGKDYLALISKIRTLAPFKSNFAAAEFPHRNFT